MGAPSVESLISKQFGFHASTSFSLPSPLSEFELSRLVQSIASQNQPAGKTLSFLGADDGDHFVPAVVRRINSSSEESSKELQKIVCELTGFSQANVTLPDHLFALSKACMMAVKKTGRKKILIPRRISPVTVQFLMAFLEPQGVHITVFSSEVFYHFDQKDFEKHINRDYAAVVLAYPDFFGNIINYEQAIKSAKAHGAAVICHCDLIALSLLKNPADFGADIAVGGDGFGFISHSPTYKPKTPRGLSPSKAAAVAYFAYMGPKGLRRVAELCYKKALYLRQEIGKIKGFGVLNVGPTFKDFLVSLPMPADVALKKLRESRIVGGLNISHFYKGKSNLILVSVTEKHLQSELDQFIRCLKALK